MAKSKESSSFLGEDQFDPASDMEQKQAHMDRVTFAPHSIEMLMGGEQHDFGKGVGPVVAGPGDYDDTMMGEERGEGTYSGKPSGRGDGARTDQAPIATGKDHGMVSGGNRKMP